MSQHEEQDVVDIAARLGITLDESLRGIPVSALCGCYGCMTGDIARCPCEGCKADLDGGAA
jgi:hypothetical protein